MQRAWIVTLFCSTIFISQLGAQNGPLLREDFLNLAHTIDSSKKNFSYQEQIFLKAVSFYKQKKWNFCTALLHPLKEDQTFLLREYVLFLLGNSYYYKGSYQLAYEHLNYLQKKYPSFVLKNEMTGVLADSLFYLKRYRESAILFLKDYNQKSPGPYKEGALLAAAFSYDQAGNAQEALALYKMFWKKNPQHLSSVFAQGKVQSLGGVLSHDDWYAHHLHYSDIHMRLEKLQKMYNELPDPGFGNLKTRILYQIGRSYELLASVNDFSVSQKSFTDFTNPRINTNLKQAQKTYIALYEKYRSPYALHRLARVAYKNAQVEVAINYHLKVAHDYPHTRVADEALYLAAFLNLEEARLETSRNLFSQHAKKYPYSKYKESTVWYVGWTYYLEKNYSEALFIFNDFLKKHKKSVHREKVLYWIGKILTESGNKNGSAQYFHELVKESPWNYYSLLVKKNSLLEEGPELASFSLPVPQKKEIGATENAMKGMVLKKLGLREWASHEFNRVVLSNVRNRELLIHLAQLFLSIEDYFRAYSLAEIYFSNIFNSSRTHENRLVWELAYPLAYKDRVEKVAVEFRVDPNMIYALMKAESNFRSNIISSANAYGLMQIIPATAATIAQELKTQNYAVQSLFDPFLNIKFGSWYFKSLLNQFENNSLLAIPSYNAGPHRTVEWMKKFDASDRDKFIEQIPFKETRDYVKKVLKYYYIYQELYNNT